MIRSYDVGSMPLEGDQSKIMEEFSSTPIPSKHFRDKMVQGLIDKIKAGIDIPNYPQYRDMNEMFLGMVEGVTKTEGSYTIEETLSLRREKSKIAEIETLKLNSKELYEAVDGIVPIKICITGPYTLSSVFSYPGCDLFTILSELITKIIQENVFKDKYAEICFLSLDEPVLGLVDDARLDFGSDGREILVKAWENILQPVKSKGITTSMHLHSTNQKIFWQVNSLNVIEPHVDDPFYTSNQAKKALEETDKLVKASVSTADFDKLIGQKMEGKSQTNSVEERIAEIWKSIKHGKIAPTYFLEETSLMERRLYQVIKHFGVERIPYAGPECGLKGFPNYSCALECLRRTSQAVKNVNEQFT
jgi:5-methyltetrahydropteroyltriglutamate--homocysteine methyltransferase